MKKAAIIIPARMKSSRFPGKPLAKVAGSTLLDLTWRRASEVEEASVIVATPDREIARHCDERNMIWMSTREDCWCGTKRCAEVASMFKPGHSIEVVVNWQVDEPEVRPMDVARLIDLVQGDHLASTLYCDQPPEDSENNAKVIVGCPIQIPVGVVEVCLYFTRTMLPGCHHHIGVYVYPVMNLVSYWLNMPETPLAKLERLEQLAWMEHGHVMRGHRTSHKTRGIDTPEDLSELEWRLRNNAN